MTVKARDGRIKAARAANLSKAGKAWALAARNVRKCARETALAKESSAAWTTHRMEDAGHAASMQTTAVS